MHKAKTLGTIYTHVTLISHWHAFTILLMSKQISLALSQRTVYGHSNCKSTKQSRATTESSTSSCDYDETSMQIAIAVVEQQEITIRHAAICYGILLPQLCTTELVER